MLTYEQDQQIFGELRRLMAELDALSEAAKLRWQEKPPIALRDGEWSSSGGAYNGAHRFYVGQGIEFVFGAYAGVNPGPGRATGRRNMYATQEDFDALLTLARQCSAAAKAAYAARAAID